MGPPKKDFRWIEAGQGAFSTNQILLNQPRPWNDDKPSGKYNTAKDACFWDLLIARNPNIIQRPVRIKLGLVGDAYADYETQYTGILEDIQETSGGMYQLIIKDKKKTLDFKVPNKISSDNLLN